MPSWWDWFKRCKERFFASSIRARLLRLVKYHPLRNFLRWSSETHCELHYSDESIKHIRLYKFQNDSRLSSVMLASQDFCGWPSLLQGLLPRNRRVDAGHLVFSYRMPALVPPVIVSVGFRLYLSIACPRSWDESYLRSSDSSKTVPKDATS